MKHYSLIVEINIDDMYKKKFTKYIRAADFSQAGRNFTDEYKTCREDVDTVRLLETETSKEKQDPKVKVYEVVPPFGDKKIGTVIIVETSSQEEIDFVLAKYASSLVDNFIKGGGEINYNVLRELSESLTILKELETRLPL